MRALCIFMVISSGGRLMRDGDIPRFRGQNNWLDVLNVVVHTKEYLLSIHLPAVMVAKVDSLHNYTVHLYIHCIHQKCRKRHLKSPHPTQICSKKACDNVISKLLTATALLSIKKSPATTTPENGICTRAYHPGA
jgi:hypothetical protein